MNNDDPMAYATASQHVEHSTESDASPHSGVHSGDNARTQTDLENLNFGSLAPNKKAAFARSLERFDDLYRKLANL